MWDGDCRTLRAMCVCYGRSSVVLSVIPRWFVWLTAVVWLVGW